MESIVNLHSASVDRSILVIYTGGTFGMRFDNSNNYLVPLKFDDLVSIVPELTRLDFNIDLLSWSTLIDSADMTAKHWNQLIEQVEKRSEYDGYVILHGTDTLAYTASAVSFGIQDFNKPIIFTGAQLPIGQVRNDARNNFLTSLEIAASAQVKEVCVFFNDKLLRANRSTKIKSADFDGFASPNFHPLARVGIDIEYYPYYFLEQTADAQFNYYSMLEEVIIIKLTPSIGVNYLRHVLTMEHLKGVVLETYGSGTVSSDTAFIETISTFIENGGVAVAVSQCLKGEVSLGKYATSQVLHDIGVLSAFEMTSEAALTKLMFLLNTKDIEEVKYLFGESLAGEVNKS